MSNSRLRTKAKQDTGPVFLSLAPFQRRVMVFFVLFAILISVAFTRALVIQGIDSEANARAAAAQLTRTQTLRADRGIIMDRNGQRLAETQPAFMVIADPTAISTNGMNPESMTDKDRARAAKAPEEISKILVQYLGGSVSDYLPKLTHTKAADGSKVMYELLKRQVSAAVYREMINALKEANWYGIYAQPDPVRYYPNQSLAANVVGFVDTDGVGRSGIEESQNEYLAGKDGSQTYQISRYGTIPLGNNTLISPINGASYHLTIDAQLQWMAENELTHAVQAHQAKSGTAIIMAVQTGEILAMATSPSFNPNKYEEADPGQLGNRAVTDAYEPGSVQKVLTMSALLDAGLITPDTHVEVPGQIMSGAAPIRDAWRHGTLHMTARGVLAQSSNVGTVELARKMDKQTLANYLNNFGLGESTGIELPGETGGAMGSVPGGDMPDYLLDQISFGQGLSVTALQEATAVAAVTNGGVYHQPTVIKKAVKADGEPIEFLRPAPRRVISEQASADIRNMMEASVASPDMHTSDSHTIPGYRMAGKSGTAQKIGKFGNYDGGYVGSYVGVAPVDNPQILVYVVIDEPKKGYYGATVAYPSVVELMEQALPRYGIAPSANIPAYTDPLFYQP